MGRARNVGVWTQRIAIAAVVAVLVGVAVRVGSTSSQSLEFRDPLIWLASNATGEVVQADAGSGDVTAQVEVGSPGDSLAVIQHGPDALVLNRTTGQVSRVNGSLLAVAESAPVQVDRTAQLLGRGENARIVTGSAVIPVDPSNAELGAAIDVPKLSSTVLDESGALWGLDPQRRVLAVTDSVAEVRVPAETRPFAIVDVGGLAQLLDGSGPTLRALEYGTGLGAGSCAGGDLGAGVAVGGSVESVTHVAVMVDSAAGVVRMSDLAAGRCTSAQLDNVAGATFGPSVESGGLAFLPVLSTGEVIVVRVAEGTVVNRFLVTGAEQPFELTVKDGTVWFNEANGAKAGVIDQDGVVERVDKYQQVEVSAANGSGQPGDDQSTPGTNNSGGSGELAGGEPTPGDGNPGAQAADGNSDAGGSDARSVGSNGGASGPVEDAPLSGLVADFTYSKRVVEVGEEVRFADRSQGEPIAWTWEFGDGSFSTGPEAAHSWDAVGAYRVTLRIESATGTAAASITIEVIDENTRSRPSADFRYSASRVEVGQAVTFTDRTTGNATGLTWDFGDGTVGTGPTVEHVWTTAGTYRVALTATNPLGSDTSEPATITVYDRVEQPTAVIEAGASQASVNQTVSFTSKSTGNPTDLEWTFGDGTSARGEIVSHAWTEPGTYTVKLQVSNSAGQSEATARVVVDERVVSPVARIIASATTVEEDQSIRFTSLSINNPTRLVWDFGDGTTDSGSSVVHTFARAGRYTVTLRASNAAGEGVATTTIVVMADVPAPVAAFSLLPESPVTVGVPVQFTDQSTGGAPSSWTWDFGDGTPSSSLRGPTHVFTEEGTYTVRLEVENNGGRDDVTRQVQVLPPKPTADFTFSPATPNAGVQVQFTDTSKNVTPGTTWSWNFGDGGTSNLRNPTHTFAERNPYNVTLTVGNPGGSSVVTKTVQVNPRAPAANFTYAPTSNITTATTVQFTFRQVNGSGDPETFSWNFDDGTTSSERNPRKVFASARTYNVTLTVTNAGGTNTSPATAIRVTVPPPSASFTVPTTPRIAGTPVVFNNTSQGAELTYSWNFGDGSAPNTERNPSHVYAARNNPYTVTLTVSNPGGTAPAASQQIRIYPQVTADFTVPATITAGQPVTFTNTSTGADSYTWTFSDGGTSTAPNGQHNFPAPNGGTYTVTLTARNAGGATATTPPRTVTVRPAAPTAAFTMAHGSKDGEVVFTNTSTGTPATYEWDFGDGSAKSTETSPTHEFDGDKAYDVKLTVTNVTNNDSVTHTVPEKPTADFDWSPNIVNVGEEVTLTSTSTGGGLTIEWFWDADADPEATGPTAKHTFDSASLTNHQVTIRVSNLWGVATRTRTIPVLP